MSMVLADTSVWISHFRKSSASLNTLLLNDQILCHPLVILELACGSPPAPRIRTLNQLKELRQATVATTDETIQFVEKNKLYESGCGVIDVALLASTMLSENALLWTHDKKLQALALKLGIAYSENLH